MEISQVNALVFESTHAEMAAVRGIQQRQVYRISEVYQNQDILQKERQAQLGIINMEPWPFSDPDFGNIRTPDGETIKCKFRNPSSFVVGTPEAYCSAMIHRQTGNWPRPIDARHYPDIGHYKIAHELWVETGGHPYGARNWAAFLALNGYTHGTTSPQTGHHYVGIRHDDNGPSLVWFHRRANGQALVSTRDGNFQVLSVDDSDYLWIKIS